MIESNHEPVPPDIVPPAGLTREALQRMNDTAGTWVDFTRPGEVIEDIDGVPTAVGPPVTERAYYARTVISRADAERVGYTPEQYPNVKVIDLPKEKRDE